MCFSATASFTAGTALVGVGSVTLRKSHGRRELRLALIPALFGIQQLSEGTTASLVVWWYVFRAVSQEVHRARAVVRLPNEGSTGYPKPNALCRGSSTDVAVGACSVGCNCVGVGRERPPEETPWTTKSITTNTTMAR